MSNGSKFLSRNNIYTKYVIFSGGSITTHKPRVYKPSHLSSATDMNTKKKFAFLSTETVPDYRPMEYNEISEKSQKTSNNQSTKFHQLQQKFNNVTLQVSCLQCTNNVYYNVMINGCCVCCIF